MDGLMEVVFLQLLFSLQGLLLVAGSIQVFDAEARPSLVVRGLCAPLDSSSFLHVVGCSCG